MDTECKNGQTCQNAIEIRHITKSFGSVVANRDVSMTVRRGEILSVLGENGSGKTTLMNMIAGIYYPDSGEIYVNGKPASIKSPGDAFALGIGMIHQHFKLVDVFTAAENIVLGLPGKLDMRAAKTKIREICDRYGFDITPEQKVYDMSVSQKQTLEIVKVLYRGADILILDEPTAVLTPQETEKLFGVMREMKRDGKSVVIITHKLHEVLSVSDRVTILRKGEYIDTVDTADATEQSLTEMMVGKKVSLDIDRPTPKNPKKRLVVENLSCYSKEGVQVLKNVSFDVDGGEIFGIAGISGSGQKELLEAIAGLQPVESGSISYVEDDGKADELIGKDPLAIADMGVALSFVPEDRLGMGLVGNMDLADNMMLRSFRRGHGLFTDRKSPRKLAQEVVDDLEVSTPGISTPVRRLSGGNVQKVLVGREIASAPTVLLTAYAVRGLDINSSYTIYDLINRQKKKGVAVIYVGEDLDVLLELADRILVLCGGKVSGIVEGRKTSKREVGMMMTKLGGDKADE